MDHRVKVILTEIENSLSQTLTLQSLASSLNLSISRFQHLFKQEVGISPTKYIKDLRLQKARELLETTDLSVKQIRTKVGLRNKVHFFRDFKQNSARLRASIAKIFTNSRNSE